MPKVAVVSLGGTIAMGAKSETGGVTPSLTAADLILAVPNLGDVAEIEAFQICNLPSPQISFRELSAVVQKIKSLEDRGFDGVVITQGTDTIEETAWVIELCCDTSLPIVVTGAMRNPTQPGADGPANLLAAVQVAASDAAKGIGILVVFNDQIHAARFVQKGHTSNVNAFSSPSCGPLGWMAEGTPNIPMRLGPLVQFGNVLNKEIPRVPIIKPGLEEGNFLIKAALDSGIDGMVIEAMGGGHTTPEFADALGLAAEQVPVVLASRTRAGTVPIQTYGFQGSEMDLLARGLVPSKYIDACKARLYLMISMMSGQSNKGIRTLFAAL